jgi:hypothetical protein
MKRLAIAMAIGSLTACSGGSSPTAPTPPADIAGPYTVFITASSTCSASLPSDARELGFFSTVTQTGAAVQMELVSHQGATATIAGTVSGQTVTFPSLSLSESMGHGATLAASASATVGAKGNLDGTLNGTYQTSSGSTCTAANHVLEMVKLCPQPTANGTALLPCP